MFDTNVGSVYLVCIALVAVLLVVYLWEKQRRKQALPVWLAASMIGILLGSVATIAVIYSVGYDIQPARRASAQLNGIANQPAGIVNGSGANRMSAPGSGFGDSMGSMPPPSLSPKQQLTTLVRKLERLTADGSLNLTDEQKTAADRLLADIESVETMSAEEAQAAHEKLLGSLEEDQKSQVEAMQLPLNGSGAGATGGGFGRPAFGSTFGGHPVDDNDTNPFLEATNATALERLRQHLRQIQHTDDATEGTIDDGSEQTDSVTEQESNP